MAITTKMFETSGMHCPSCSMLIELTLNDVDGVVSATSDYRTAMTEVTFDSERLSAADVVDEIVKAGYGAEPVSEEGSAR